MVSMAYLTELERMRTEAHSSNCVSHRIPNSQHTEFLTTRAHRMRPVTFRPNGSHSALIAQGKLMKESTQQASELKLAEGERPQTNRQYMPGYTGFVRGMQHVSGRTYGESSRRCLDTDYREHVCTSPIPSAPQNNRKIRQIQPKTSFVTHQFAGKRYHVPGYTGHVPGVRDTYAQTFGGTTTQELYKSSLAIPRVPSNVPRGYADSFRPRQLMALSSAPLAGPTFDKAPIKLVPSHLKQLRYFGN
jgi:hypothetical protein